MAALIPIYMIIPKQSFNKWHFPWLIWDSCVSQDLWAILPHKNWDLYSLGLVKNPIFSLIQLLFIICTPSQATINFMPLLISSCTSASFILFTIGKLYLPNTLLNICTTIPLSCSSPYSHLHRCNGFFRCSSR